MEITKHIILGILLGVGGMYLFQDTQVVTSSSIVKGIEKECLEEKETKLRDRESSLLSKSIKEVQKIAQNQKRIKTPDELYEEQQEEIEESRLTNDVQSELEEDRILIPLELEQAERESSFNSTNVDETLIPQELQEAEVMTDEERGIIIYNEDIPSLEAEVVDEEIETKSVISENLKTLEKYGDPDGIPQETEIPK